MRKNKFLSWMLSLVMALTVCSIPTGTFAEGDELQQGEVNGYPDISSIQEIQYHSDVVLYENTGGWWEHEYETNEEGEDIPTGKRYYEYDYGWNEGDTLTLVDAAGNADVYICKKVDLADYDYSLGFINENGNLIGMDDIDLQSSLAQRERHWQVGSDNVFSVEYQGLKAEIRVTIEESPVDSVTVTPTGQYTVTGDAYETETGLDGKNYRKYYIPEWNEGDKITIKYKDGTTKKYALSFDENGYEVWKLVGGKEILAADELSLESDQEIKHWNGKIGATNTFYAVFMGKKSNALKAKIVRTLTKAKVTLVSSSLVYTGKARKPAVRTMKYGSSILRKGTHYISDYCDRAIGVGNYEIVFAGVGSYGGYKEAPFKVIPKGAAIAKPKAAKKAITVKWKKQGTKMKYLNANRDTKSAHITGYQVQYCRKSYFKGAKIRTVKGFKKTSLKITKLKKKKKYYVRVRTYMTVKGVGNFYSRWSRIKTIKTK